VKVGDLVKSLMPVSFHSGNGQAGIIMEVIHREVGGTMYRILWTDGELEYMAGGDVEMISESR
jgi:hypothetical protein